MVRELGIEVIVPPLHHRVVTARVRVSGPAKLRAARTRLERQLAGLERRYPSTPAGVGVTLAWGLPYFRQARAEGTPTAGATRTTCRSTCARRKRAGRRSPPCSTRARFASDGPEVVLGGDDVAVLIRSDDVAHIDDAQKAIFGVAR